MKNSKVEALAAVRSEPPPHCRQRYQAPLHSVVGLPSALASAATTVPADAAVSRPQRRPSPLDCALVLLLAGTRVPPPVFSHDLALSPTARVDPTRLVTPPIPCLCPSLQSRALFDLRDIEFSSRWFPYALLNATSGCHLYGERSDTGIAHQTSKIFKLVDKSSQDPKLSANVDLLIPHPKSLHRMVEVEDGKIMQTTMEKKSKRGTALWIRLRLRFLTPLMVLCFSPKAKQSFTQVKSELFSNSTATAHLLLGQDSSGRPRFGPRFLTNNVLKTGSLN
ncbi:hypothetical protein ZIOFF_016739 [Zingiber officinale]|uniref:Uncharacterized protein n=1 Tax=Zingiber officinale TaxID=94328 RepID=A0A8J5LHU3_ZINOF|nr:hypothetical protein ZIOFF_016739 [Zingiber officinale]